MPFTLSLREVRLGRATKQSRVTGLLRFARNDYYHTLLELLVSAIIGLDTPLRGYSTSVPLEIE